MYTEQEFKDAMEELHSFIDALKVKYGPEFSCILSTGVGIDTKNTDEPDAFAGSVCMMGNDAMFHQACHSLLRSCKFIDGIIGAMQCVIIHEHRNNGSSKTLDAMVIAGLESLKKILMKTTDEYKEKLQEQEIDNAVDELLKDVGLKI